MSESEQKTIEILRILEQAEKPVGSKKIANELKNKGYNLGERAVRYHMQLLDEKGYTERIGYSGRKITELGKSVLEKGLVYDQVDFTFSKFEEYIYQTTFNPNNKTGNVIVNTSHIFDDEGLELIKKVFQANIAVSPLVKLEKSTYKGKEGYSLRTICGTTIDGVLLNNSISTQPQYGGLLEVKDYVPKRFTELISYKKTSITPLDAFVGKNMTSVLNVVKEGNGTIPANFRVIPSVARDKTVKIINKLKKANINGVIAIGKEGQDILGVPVPKGTVGVAICGGVTPFCAAQELDYDVDIKLGEDLNDYSELKPITSTKTILKRPNNKTNYEQIPFLLSKSWNLIQKVDYNYKTKKGNIIANISYIDKEDIDDALDIMEKTYNDYPNYINPYYKIVKNEDNSDKVGIATVCSLSVDGILIKNGIMSLPKYGGLLEIGNPSLFTELISYGGSSIDPHKIYISKNLTSITQKDTPQKILASIKEVPLIAREDAEVILNKLNGEVLSIYKIGKPREVVYNAKVNNYNFGVVAGSGLNSIAAILEEGINIEVKALEGLMPLNEMNKF